MLTHLRQILSLLSRKKIRENFNLTYLNNNYRFRLTYHLFFKYQIIYIFDLQIF